MSSADSKLFQTITTDNIKDVLGSLHQSKYYIITAESGFCPACHSDLSSANITAPNSLLGHLRRSKKCIQKRADNGIQLFGLKQPDSLLWGSVDDIMALDSHRFPNKHVWAQQVFPPTRPQMGAPMYNSVSQWGAREGYSSASPPPSSGSSDDGWNGSGASSSGGSSPTSSNFGQYAMPSHPHGHPAQYALSYDPTVRRESTSTITPADYYAQKQAKMSAGLQQISNAAKANNQYYAAGQAPGMGIGAQYRGQQQQPPIYAAQQVPMYVPQQPQQYMPAGYPYPAQQAQPAFSW